MIIRDLITSRLKLIFPEISGKFPEILNFRKFHNPTPDPLAGFEGPPGFERKGKRRKGKRER